MWFLGFALEEKLHGAKCWKYYGPEGVSFKDQREYIPYIYSDDYFGKVETSVF